MCTYKTGNFIGLGSEGVKGYSHSVRITCDTSAVSLLDSEE